MLCSNIRFDASYYTPKTTRFLVVFHVLGILLAILSEIIAFYVVFQNDGIDHIVALIMNMSYAIIGVCVVIFLFAFFGIWATLKQNRKALRVLIGEMSLASIALFIIAIWTLGFPPNDKQIFQGWLQAESGDLNQ